MTSQEMAFRASFVKLYAKVPLKIICPERVSNDLGSSNYSLEKARDGLDFFASFFHRWKKGRVKSLKKVLKEKEINFRILVVLGRFFLHR